MNVLNFNDPQALPALYTEMAENDSVADRMVDMVNQLLGADLPIESKHNILTEAQAVLSKVRKDGSKQQTAYQYSSRAKTIFGAAWIGETLIEADGRNCARIYSDAQKFLKSQGVNWKGDAVEPKAESTPESEVAAAAVSVDVADASAALETVEKHAAHLLATKGADYVLELMVALTALIDKPVQQAA